MKLTIGAITGGPFLHGEVVIQTTSGAFGRVVGTTYGPDGTMGRDGEHAWIRPRLDFHHDVHHD